MSRRIRLLRAVRLAALGPHPVENRHIITVCGAALLR